MNLKYKPKSIRSFIGSKNYEESRQFYRELGWDEDVISKDMVRIKVTDDLTFYLQDYYVKKWNDNSMLFLEVEDVDICYDEIKSKELPEKYKNVRLTEIKTFDWGREFFMHDPSGVLWHFGEFNKTISRET